MNSNTSDCNHDCKNCNSKCESSLLANMNENSNIKKVIGVVSGKGGVGKSFVTSLLACNEVKLGNNVAILDADITGPSIPKVFGIKEKARANEQGILPVTSKNGLKIMSINLLLDNETQPVVWRGPIIGGTVKQFWTDVVWGDIDWMFVDMPPGTGDVTLTVFQSLPLDGIVIVTSPQDLVTMIVEKAINMSKMMNIPIIGFVENMSYFECPNCKEKHEIFGRSKSEEIIDKYGLKLLGKIPFNSDIALFSDNGKIYDLSKEYLMPISSIWE